MGTWVIYRKEGRPELGFFGKHDIYVAFERGTQAFPCSFCFGMELMVCEEKCIGWVRGVRSQVFDKVMMLGGAARLDILEGSA